MTNGSNAPSLEPMSPPSPVRSRLAVGSLITSVLPLVSPVGFVLGVIALMRMRGRPWLEGKMLAWAGVSVSAVVTVATYGSGYMLYQAVRQLAERPANAMRAAFAGDVDAFRAQATGAASKVTTVQLAAWTADLQSRFGQFEGVTFAANKPTHAPTATAQGDSLEGAYVVQFAREAVATRFLFEMDAEMGSRPDAYRIRRIIMEPASETIIFFPDAPPSVPSTAPATSP